MIVLDASLVGPLAIADERSSLSDAVADRLLTERILVPSHWRLEVASMIQTAIKRGRVLAKDRAAIFSALGDLRIEVDGATWIAAWNDTLELADRHGLTPYDAAYLEVACRMDAMLATLDTALTCAAKAENVPLFDLT